MKTITPRADPRRRVIRRALAAALCWAAAAVLQAERLPIHVYTSADGLANDAVVDVLQDSHGFLWFATGHGLSRFDGYRFTSYGTAQGLVDPEIEDLLESRDGSLWLATGAGVARFRPRGKGRGAALFELVEVGSSALTNSVLSLYEDRAGRLWAGTGDGLFRLDRKASGVVATPIDLGLPRLPAAGVSVRGILEDREGSLWLATRLGLVKRLADGRTQWHPAMGTPDDRIFWLHFDSEGRLWAGHVSYGLFVLMPTAAPTPLLPPGVTLAAAAAAGGPAVESDGRLRLPGRPGEIRRFTAAEGLSHDGLRGRLLRTDDGRLWIGSVRGVTLYERGRFRAFGRRQGLIEDGASPACEDRAGNLWLGSQSGGAMRIAGGGLTAFDARDGLGFDSVRWIHESRAGELVVLSSSAVSGEVPSLARRDGERFTAMRLPESGALGWGWNQIGVEDRAGEWWFAGTHVLRYPRPARLADLARAPPNGDFTPPGGVRSDAFRIYEDRSGDIWVGSFGSPPLSRWQRSTRSWRHYTPADGIPSDVPTSFAEDREGNLWIGLWWSGLVRRRGERFERFGTAEGVPAGSIWALLPDHAGRLWMASSVGGVGRMDDPAAERPQIERLTTADGLSSDQVWSLCEDPAGRIYVGTGRGLDRLDPKNGRIRRYTTADGLAGSRVATAYCARAGVVWLGGFQGLSRLLPTAERPRVAPPIRITGLRIGGAPRPLSELGEEAIGGLELRAGQSQLEIEFVALSFAAGERLRYQHRLAPTAEWSAPSEQPSVLLANLAPGRYRFEARAVTADGLLSPRPARVEFDLPPPVWRRGWSLLLVAAAAALLALTFHRQRLERLLAVERVRTRIATDLHDDLGASLSRISILSEAARHQLGRGEAPAGRLGEIADTARGLVDAAADIVWSIDPRRDDLHSLITRLRRFAAELLEAQGVAWSLTEPAGAGALRLAPEMRQHLFLILKEALSNVARHAGARQVEVSIAIAGGRLLAAVRDDGRGFTPLPPAVVGDDGVTAPGNGLSNMRARARALGGELLVESAPGAGTRVSAELPLGRHRAPWRWPGA